MEEPTLDQRQVIGDQATHHLTLLSVSMKGHAWEWLVQIIVQLVHVLKDIQEYCVQIVLKVTQGQGNINVLNAQRKGPT